MHYTIHNHYVNVRVTWLIQADGGATFMYDLIVFFKYYYK